jgi:hypothetical protein
MSIINLTPSQLRHAADLKEKIASLNHQLAGIIYVGGKAHAPAKVALPARKKGGMSAAGRARIAAAQKARWAKVHAAKAKPAAAAKPAKKKFTMSAAAKAKISAAAKARWAKFHAAKGRPAAKPAARKKGKISAEGIARIKAAQKLRWAKVHAAKAAKAAKK